jgi:hypothetical protein
MKNVLSFMSTSVVGTLVDQSIFWTLLKLLHGGDHSSLFRI